MLLAISHAQRFIVVTSHRVSKRERSRDPLSVREGVKSHTVTTIAGTSCQWRERLSLCAWSVYGAQQAQLVASNGKSQAGENR
jgi:hypothetical protein